MASIGKDRSKVKKDEKREEEADVEKTKSGSSRTIFLKFQIQARLPELHFLFASCMPT